MEIAGIGILRGSLAGQQRKERLASMEPDADSAGEG